MVNCQNSCECLHHDAFSLSLSLSLSLSPSFPLSSPFFSTTADALAAEMFSALWGHALTPAPSLLRLVLAELPYQPSTMTEAREPASHSPMEAVEEMTTSSKPLQTVWEDVIPLVSCVCVWEREGGREKGTEKTLYKPLYSYRQVSSLIYSWHLHWHLQLQCGHWKLQVQCHHWSLWEVPLWLHSTTVLPQPHAVPTVQSWKWVVYICTSTAIHQLCPFLCNRIVVPIQCS